MVTDEEMKLGGFNVGDMGAIWKKVLDKYIEIKDKTKEFIAHKFKKENFKLLKDFQLSKDATRKALIGLMVFSMFAMGFTAFKVNEIRTRAFDIYINEVKVGSARDENTLVEIIDELENELSKIHDMEILINDGIELEPTHLKDKEISTYDELRKEIKSTIDFVVAAYALNIDGEEIGVLKCENDAKEVVKRIQDYHLENIPENSRIEDYKIVENIEYIKKEVNINELDEIEDLVEYIKDGGEEIKTHIIEVGENFWTLALFYNTTMEELEKANPDKEPRRLMPGDEIKLVMPVSKITVETIEEVEYTEAISFDVEVETSSSMYKNQSKIKVSGKRGETKILAKEIKHNGILVDKQVIKEEVVKEPVTQVVVKGTKEVPKTVATGIFLMPTRGRISSAFGRRWGRMHKGIDIAASHGAAIKAADGGTVVFSGWKNSYGYMIEINHGNGYTTKYAHCSALHVKAGAKVYKGQHIANVGSTGNSTGSHLHFEVLRYGSNLNPSNFVR